MTRALLALVCMTGCLAGCGSSSSSSSTASSTASSSGTASAAGSSGAGASASVKAAQAGVARYSAAPTKIALTTPLKRTPTKGETFVNMQCNLSQCGIITQGIDKAAAAVGWKVKTLTYDAANPASLTSGLSQALQYQPVATALSGLPQAVWQSSEAAYAKAGSALVVGAVGPATTNSTVLTDLEGPANIERQAQALADWFISDSNGKGSAVLLNVPGFPILNNFAEDFQTLVKSGCSGCKVSTLSASVAQAEANSLPQTIVTALRRDSSASYFISCDSAFIVGLPPALKAAGLSKVKIAGMWGIQATEAEIKSGEMATSTTEASEYLGALMVDAALRRSEHMAIPSDAQYQLPIRLLSKSNVGTPANSNDYPSDWLAQLEKLWKVK